MDNQARMVGQAPTEMDLVDLVVASRAGLASQVKTD